MSFTKYPEYIESGIDWLGPVPITWLIQRSDAVLKSTRRQIDPSQFAKEEVFHYSIPSVQEIGTGRIEDGSEIASAKQLIDKKVVLVSKLNPRKATTCIAEPKGRLTLCSTEFVSLEPKNLSIEYLAYLVQGEGFRQSLESKVMSVTNSHQRAEPSDIYRFWMALPSQLEQQKISTFLDRETAKIDALVAEQERLIELLEEKRQAVISHAVTKGLDARVSMMPPEFPWPPTVPTHWKLKSLKYLSSRISSGKTPSGGGEAYVSEGTLFIRSQNVYDDGLRLEDVVYISEAMDESMASTRILPGDILLNITGASIGRSCIVPNDFPRANVNQHVCAIRLKNPSFRPFASHFLKSSVMKGYVDFVQNGAAREGLNFKQIGDMAIPVPPMDEQLRIVEYIESNSRKFDQLIDESKALLAVLSERRSALISAAVTGQIFVHQLEVA